eukprot:g19017.t1
MSVGTCCACGREDVPREGTEMCYKCAGAYWIQIIPSTRTISPAAAASLLGAKSEPHTTLPLYLGWVHELFVRYDMFRNMASVPFDCLLPKPGLQNGANDPGSTEEKKSCCERLTPWEQAWLLHNPQSKSQSVQSNRCPARAEEEEEEEKSEQRNHLDSPLQTKSQSFSLHSLAVRTRSASSNKLEIFVTSKQDQAKIPNCAYCQLAM